MNLIDCLRCSKNEIDDCYTCKYAVMYNGKFDHCDTQALERDAAQELEKKQTANKTMEGLK